MTRILIVEDSVDILFILKTELEWEGFQVEIAAGGKEGLDTTKRWRPDLILCDVRMPEVDGFEFVKRVRQNLNLTAIPVVALSGLCLREEVEAGLNFGFAAYLKKPIDMAELLNVIQNLTAKKLQKAS